MTKPDIAPATVLPEDAHCKRNACELFENLDAKDDFGLMSVDELARSFDKDPKTIRNWVARREIPFIALGNRTVFRRDAVRDWLQNQEVKPHGSL